MIRDTQRPTIVAAYVVVESDPSPDLSWLGCYSNEYAGGAIDRQARGDYHPGECRYWHPGPNHYPHNPRSWDHVSDADVVAALHRITGGITPDILHLIDYPPTVRCNPPTDRPLSDPPHTYSRERAIRYLDAQYIEQDYQRMEAYCRGEWSMLIVYTELCLSDGQTVRSAGCGGIESDSDSDHLDTIVGDELAAARSWLEQEGARWTPGSRGGAPASCPRASPVTCACTTTAASLSTAMLRPLPADTIT